MADLSMPVRRSTTEPSNLAVAIRIAEHTLDSDNPTAIREALRILAASAAPSPGWPARSSGPPRTPAAARPPRSGSAASPPADGPSSSASPSSCARPASTTSPRPPDGTTPSPTACRSSCPPTRASRPPSPPPAAAGDRGRWSAIIGACLALGLAMAAQVVSHLITTGHVIADQPVLIAVTSLVPPAVVGHLLHLAASPPDAHQDARTPRTCPRPRPSSTSRPSPRSCRPGSGSCPCGAARCPP
jgi:hypothetical protein